MAHSPSTTRRELLPDAPVMQKSDASYQTRPWLLGLPPLKQLGFWTAKLVNFSIFLDHNHMQTRSLRTQKSPFSLFVNVELARKENARNVI
jgi:hypothetical protein